MARRRLNKQQWLDLIQEFEQSKATQVDFARAHDVTVGSFRAWLYRVRKDQQPSKSSFLEVRSASNRIEESNIVPRVCIEVHGLRITFESSPSMGALADLLSRLAGSRAC